MERENRIMFARKHGLERQKRAYRLRKRVVVAEGEIGEEDQEEEEDPLTLQEVEDERQQENQASYRVYDEEEEEEG